MVEKCANNWCPTTRHHHAGKLFRLDIDLGSKAGGHVIKTEYIWLCASCAQQMHPKVVVTGDTVRVLLSKNESIHAADTAAAAASASTSSAAAGRVN
jgi:hypothetical protein